MGLTENVPLPQEAWAQVLHNVNNGVTTFSPFSSHSTAVRLTGGHIIVLKSGWQLGRTAGTTSDWFHHCIGNCIRLMKGGIEFGRRGGSWWC